MVYKYEAIAMKIRHNTEHQLDQGRICAQIQDVFFSIFTEMAITHLVMEVDL